MTTWLNVKNNSSSALASGITAAAASLALAAGDGAKFPASNFHITIDDEILLCTLRSGDILTVARPREGTVAAPHATGSVVSLNVTAGIITELQSNLDEHAAAVTDVHSLNKSCVAYNNAGFTIPTASLTQLTFNSEVSDTDNIHSTSTNMERLACKTAGLYLIHCMFEWGSESEAGGRYAEIRLNGTTQIASSTQAIRPGGYARAIFCVLYSLAVNDYVTAHVYQNSGGNVSIRTPGGGVPAPTFSMVRIA